MTTPMSEPAPEPVELTEPTLVGRLGQLAEGVEGLRRAVAREQELREKEAANAIRRIDAADHARRRSTWALAVVAVALLVGVVGGFAQNVKDRHQRQDLETLFKERAALVDQREVDRCETGNASRDSIRNGFSSFTDALAAVPPAVPRTPEEQARFAERLASFRADLDGRLAPLAPQDCSREALGLHPSGGDGT